MQGSMARPLFTLRAALCPAAFCAATLCAALPFVIIAGGCHPVEPVTTSRPASESSTHRSEASEADDQGVTAETSTAASTSAEPESPNRIRILAWNIESGGADINVIGAQLDRMPRYAVYGFTEVDRSEWPVIKETLGENYAYWYSNSGFRDRTAFAFDKMHFELIKKYEMEEFEGTVLNPGKYRSPHVHELRDKVTGREITFVLNHFARGDAAIRYEQAKGLRRWAASKDSPIIAIGDYNFDYVFDSKKGNSAFEEFMKESTFEWIKPVPLIDSNWFDGDKDGQDDYPGSILDFCFVAGDAKSWNARSRVIVRDHDFPDDETTSDHRPIELVITPTPL